MLPSPTSPTYSSSFAADTGQPPTDPESSANENIEKRKAIVIDNSQIHGAEAKPLSLYSVTRRGQKLQADDSSICVENAAEIPDIDSLSIYETNTTDANSSEKQARLHYSHPEAFALATRPVYAIINRKSHDLISKLIRQNLSIFHPRIPASGYLLTHRVTQVMKTLSNNAYDNAFPKNIISIGSGLGFMETLLSYMKDTTVKCYDKNPANKSFMPIEQAEFPRDTQRCLPKDCSNWVLFAGYPQGYLGPVLSTFIQRGGKMLCTTVEDSLFGSSHLPYEADPEILKNGIKDLRKHDGTFFQFDLSEDNYRAGSCYIQFYNWPLSVKESMFNNQLMKDRCNNITFENDELS